MEMNCRNDLLQLQTILGKKKFLLGDEPTAVKKQFLIGQVLFVLLNTFVSG